MLPKAGDTSVGPVALAVQQLPRVFTAVPGTHQLAIACHMYGTTHVLLSSASTTSSAWVCLSAAAQQGAAYLWVIHPSA
jgi:hypothetical protein